MLLAYLKMHSMESKSEMFTINDPPQIVMTLLGI